jgi:hypothetical protein
MSNQSKAELKILIFEKEIEEYKRQLKIANEQKFSWMGCKLAYEEANEIFKVLFKDLKYALDWLGKDENEKKTLIEKNPNCVPKVQVTESEGFKIAEFLKPAHQLVSLKLNKSKREPELFEAQKTVLNRQIDRLNRYIIAERNKDFSKEVDDPFDELNKEDFTKQDVEQDLSTINSDKNVVKLSDSKKKKKK